MIHLHRDMENVHREILSVSAIVEEMIDKASGALRERNREWAEEVISRDSEVDAREVHIEEECLKMLALHQPVAVDLRRVVTVLKVNNDLERIADLAVNVAERAQRLVSYPEFPIPETLERMAITANKMVRQVLDAFVNMDADACRLVCQQDDEVDQYNRQVIVEIEDLVLHHPESIKPALHCFSASRHVERIADHATNIAEDVIYLVEGEIVRHQPDSIVHEL